MIDVTNQNIEEELYIPIDDEWNFGTSKALKMHNVHAYPAKFPAFIASKVFDYAKNEGVNIKTVADIFCGCGTVSLESRIKNYDFWGCDINPVATLIANVKSKKYSATELKKKYDIILTNYNDLNIDEDIYTCANERLKYWYTENSYTELYKLKQAIKALPKGKYQDAFLCIFSSILKPTSKWLNKSIKPQVDPNKNEVCVLDLFEKQFRFFQKAVEENQFKFSKNAEIENKNFLKCDSTPKVDLIVTSPPYVTSYEYADLHQLSALWLDYTKDYKCLRKGTVGSIYFCEDFNIKNCEINKIGLKIISDLEEKLAPSKLKSVARYYTDMEKVLKKSYYMLNDKGMIFLVVGDTEYKEVKIENSKHLIKTMQELGFKDIKITRRKISNKSLTPYRDKNGKFTSDKTEREIYHEEFLISGRKYNVK